MDFLTKVKDTDIEIMNKMDDETLINFCHSNSEILRFCNINQQFWLNRIITKYFGLDSKNHNIPIDVLLKYKGNQEWSEYYIKDLKKITPGNAQEYLNKRSYYGRLDYVIAALNLGANINYSIPAGGYTPLQLAIGSNRTDIVKYLIENGADINLEDEYGYNALKLAISRDSLDIFKLLVENGVELNSDLTPFAYAKIYGSEDIVKYLESL